ncbi:hypothetical protein E0493_13630 [Roseomonas sp. M0104]|uniref:Phosphate starvation-inducible protein PsiF n=1 Tax=Teichococcus coralli TaxID=2545983 RepID=A0A845BE37_9PROT|nr:PsiF family protein [Pseudoroseomonas coralli]MXP64386.1 hypothetical protein [Pseudoroseomonas coralli]
MKPLLFLLTAAALACATPALARGKATGEAVQHRAPSPARLAQQERMRGCNATARTQNLHGAPRKEFMRGCLRKH